MDHLYSIDGLVEELDFSELDNYNWMPFPGHEQGWLTGRTFYVHDGEETARWADDAPNIAKLAHELSVQAFKKLKPDSGEIELSRCMVHKYSSDSIFSEEDIHRDDFDRDYWSTILYVHGDGDTYFYTQSNEDSYVRSIDFKTGRLAVFPAGYWHRATQPMKNDYRIVVALIYKMTDFIDLSTEVPGYRWPCQCGLSVVYPFCDGRHAGQ
jgi:hypothetical protein